MECVPVLLVPVVLVPFSDGANGGGRSNIGGGGGRGVCDSAKRRRERACCHAASLEPPPPDAAAAPRALSRISVAISMSAAAALWGRARRTAARGVAEARLEARRRDPLRPERRGIRDTSHAESRTLETRARKRALEGSVGAAVTPAGTDLFCALVRPGAPSAPAALRSMAHPPPRRDPGAVEGSAGALLRAAAAINLNLCMSE
jgi:hypothetical protein